MKKIRRKITLSPPKIFAGIFCLLITVAVLQNTYQKAEAKVFEDMLIENHLETMESIDLSAPNEIAHLTPEVEEFLNERDAELEKSLGEMSPEFITEFSKAKEMGREK